MPTYRAEGQQYERDFRKARAAFWRLVRDCGGELDSQAGISHHGSDCPLGMLQREDGRIVGLLHARFAMLKEDVDPETVPLRLIPGPSDPTYGHSFHAHRCVLVLAVLTPEGICLLSLGDCQEGRHAQWSGPYRVDPSRRVGYGGGFWERWVPDRLYDLVQASAGSTLP